jgi:hypothetical protein
MMKKYIVALFLIPWFFIMSSQAQADCRVEQSTNLILPQTIGQLIYIENSTIQTLDGIVASNLENLYNPVISLDGTRIAWLNEKFNRPRDSAELYIYNFQSEELNILDIFVSDGIEPYIIQWISSNEMMIIYISSKIRIPEFYPGSIINIDTNETMYLFPNEINYLFNNTGISSKQLIDYIDYQPLLPPRFSPNGQYLILNKRSTYNYFVIDLGVATLCFRLMQQHSS